MNIITIPPIEIVGIIIFVSILIIAIKFKRVVPMNEIHILQRGSKTIVKGEGFLGGNVYYAFPKWFPLFGVSVTKIPLYVFDVKLEKYKAYDIENIPFKLDVIAYFVVKDPLLAAKKIKNFDNIKEILQEYLEGVVKSTIEKNPLKEVVNSTDKIIEKLYEQMINISSQLGLSLQNIQITNISDIKNLSVVRNTYEKTIKS